MIPKLSASGALPPFMGADATQRADCSPYIASMSELGEAFVHSVERATLMTGLLNYRAALRAAGVTDGFQVIDGSFTEDCERLRGRAPSDIDLVTFASLPVIRSQAAQFLQANMGLFTPALTKRNFACDAYFIDLGKPPPLLVSDTTYFMGLFSHQRVTALWKGAVQVPLVSDDQALLQAIAAYQP